MKGFGATAPAHFRYSVMLWTIDSKLPVERCIEIAAAAGYQGVELVSEYKPWSIEDTRRMLSRVRNHGLVVDAIACGGVTLADPAGRNKLLAQLTEHVEIAKRLECSKIIMTSGHCVEGLSREQQHAACVENLKHLSELAAKRQVELLIEPIDLLEDKSAYLNSVSEGFAIARAVGSSHVRILYDFYHEQRQAGNLIEKLERNVDWVGLVHVADVPGRHDPGTGEIDYRTIYRKLAELNYRGFIAMEYYPIGDPMASLKTARLVAEQAADTPFAPYVL